MIGFFFSSYIFHLRFCKSCSGSNITHSVVVISIWFFNHQFPNYSARRAVHFSWRLSRRTSASISSSRFSSSSILCCSCSLIRNAMAKSASILASLRSLGKNTSGGESMDGKSWSGVGNRLADDGCSIADCRYSCNTLYLNIKWTKQKRNDSSSSGDLLLVCCEWCCVVCTCVKCNWCNCIK